MEEILLNDVVVYGEIVPEENNEFRLSFEVRGGNNYHLFSNLIAQKILDLKIPSREMEFKIKRLTSSSTYNGLLNEETLVKFSFTYREYNPDEENEWNEDKGFGIVNIMNWARTRAIAELLEEKGLLSLQEYEDKINIVFERDKEEMVKFISEGFEKED